MKSLKQIFAMTLCWLALAGAVSCNKHDDESTSSYVYTSSTTSTLVSSFKLQADATVMANLDSVYFSIDPSRGVIYNADSLPVGTDVTALRVTLTFGSTVSEATFRVFDADGAHTDHNYTSTSSEAMDFSRPVTLTVTSTDGLHTTDYDVRVNVHRVEPDSIVWPAGLRRNLPDSRDENYDLGVAYYRDAYWCLLRHSDGYSMSRADSPAGPWTATALGSGIALNASTLTATVDALYALDPTGQLHHSTDGLAWLADDKQWTTILGAYQGRLLGLARSTDGTTTLDCHPRPEGFEPQAVPEGFPVIGSSQLLTVSSDWALAPQAMLVGGLTADGTPTAATWGYDGTRWARLSSTSSALPALEGPTLLSYYTYSKGTGLSYTQRTTWMVMGGRMADGTLNTTTYVSHNRGISWTAAGTALSLPDGMAPYYGALAMVHSRTMEQGAVSWQCPYIYLFGGRDGRGVLQNNVWTGVLNRLMFKPIL